MLSGPYPFATLGNPLNGQDAKTYSSEVWSVLDHERKKRLEILLATDNEGINIFDARSTTLLATYAVPPQCAFTCSPHSICLRGGVKSSRRLTFCALRTADSVLKLQCFAGVLEKKNKINGNFSVTSKELPPGKIPFHLESSTSKDSATVVLFVTFQDGDVAVCSVDLSEMKFIARQKKKGRECKHAMTLSISQAKAGILQRREDLLARFEASLSTSRLLVIVERSLRKWSKSGPILHITLIGLLHEPHQGRGTNIPNTEIVGSFDIELPKLCRETAGCFLHHSGQMFAWDFERIFLYQLDGTTSKNGNVINLGDHINSLLRISANVIAVSCPSFIKIVDIKHSAVLSTYSINPNSSANDDAITDPQGGKPWHLLSFFPTLRNLVLLHERTISTLSFNDSKSVLTHRTTLAGAVGRGLGLNRTSHQATHSNVSGFGELIDEGLAKDGERISRIEKIAKTRNVDEFDDEFARLLKRMGKPVDPGNPSTEHRISSLKLAQHSQLFSHIVCKIFALKSISDKEKQQRALEVGFMPPQTFQNLVHHNLVTLHRIELALKHTKQLSLTETLHPCALIEALATYDYSLQTLMFLLAASTPLTVQEVAYAIRYPLDVFQQVQNLSNLRLMTDTEMADHSDSDSENRNEDGASEPEKDTEMANHSDSDSENRKDEGTSEPEKDADKIHDARSVMRVCLTRLHLCHDSDIRAGLTKELSNLHLLSLIDYLRAELAGGGWFLHCIKDPAPSEDLIQENSQITLMARVLNCVIDSLGAGAWLNSVVSDEYVEKVAWMKAETSIALEGIEEATYLQGLLHEALLYAKRANPAIEHHREGAVMSISGPVKLHDEDEDNALPLGLRPSNRVEKKTVEKGKVKVRSKREVALLKSKLVGAYSIDRITI